MEENIEWKDYEVSFMNDEVLTYFSRTGYKYTDGMESLWDFMYCDLRKILIDRWNTWHRYRFNQSMTGLSPREGDILEVIALDKDLATQHTIGERSEFSFQYSQYWVSKVMNGSNLFKIVDRTKYDWTLRGIVPKFPRNDGDDLENLFDKHFFGKE